MDALLQDLRYALRTLVNNPGFAALTIVCLAVGIGVNSTIFSVVDAIVLRPLPFADPEALVVLDSTHLATGVDSSNVSLPDLQDWRARGQVFTVIAASTSRNFSVTDRDESERFNGSAISANLFPMLGVQPVLGRYFTEDDDRAGAADVVILGNDVWRRKFLADPSIVGRTISVNGRPFTVVGVMPPRFRFPGTDDIWVPLVPAIQNRTRTNRALQVIARLKEGASLDDARRDIGAVANGLAAEFHENDGWSATAVPLREDMLGDEPELISLTMMGAVSLVLLIACANVANLLLARAASRQREIAVRTALGAGRGRIVRQLLTESLCIGLASAPLGIGLASVGLRALTASVPPDDPIPYYVNWDMSWRVVVYTAGMAVLTGLIFGLAPALQAADRDLHHSLKDGGRGTATSARRNRIRNVLIVGEVALSLTLLVGASLFVRSFLKLQRAESGMDTVPMMSMRVFMTGEPYATTDQRVRRMDDIVQRVEALPNVEAAFASTYVPLFTGGSDSKVATETFTPEPGGQAPQATYFAVTANVLRTLGVPLLAGRTLTTAEGLQRSGVAVVNQRFVKQFFNDRSDVVGQRFRLLDVPGPSQGGVPGGRQGPGGDDWLTIIGLVADFKPWNARDEDTTPFAFVGYPYSTTPVTGLTIRVAGGAPAAITSLVRNEVRKSDAHLAVFDTRTGEQNRMLSYWTERLFGWMFSIFGGVALLLAAIGIYGVLSYSVAQRTQEIGVRMALGASRKDVFRLVIGHGAKLTVIGIAIGVVLSFGVTRVIRTFLYNVTPTDPLSFAGTALFLAAVALLAGYVPARRATAVDPIVALRAE